MHRNSHQSQSRIEQTLYCKLKRKADVPATSAFLFHRKLFSYEIKKLCFGSHCGGITINESSGLLRGTCTRSEQKFDAKATAPGARVLRAELFVIKKLLFPSESIGSSGIIKEALIMIIIFKENAPEQEICLLREEIKAIGLDIHESKGKETLLWGLVGDTSKINMDWLCARKVVESVKRVQEPYKKANRKFHPEDTVVDVSGKKIGGGHFQVIAGPCSIETTQQMNSVAKSVAKSGAGLLRGGAFKPRTSPYSFQGLHDEGLKMLLEAKKACGLPVVTELMTPEHIDLFQDVDLIQIGARNMQNFELLKEVGKLKTPVLLKRGLANTLEELLMSAEYIMAGGNENVILCERGIRTFEPSMRNTLDLSAIPMLKSKSHLPVVVDPSHACGIRWMVEPMALAAVAAGADGLMIEVHNDPEKALCDGPQSLTPEMFDKLMKKILRSAEFFHTMME